MRGLVSASVGLLLTCLAARAGDAIPFTVGDFTFTPPVGWLIEKPVPPEKARLGVGTNREGAEVTFFYYGNKGAEGAENVARWFRQFSGGESKRNVRRVRIGDVKITYASTEGTYSIGSAEEEADPMTGYALCGAVLENANGAVYVKMIGPAATVRGATQAFKTMISAAARRAQRS
jgi:hypothetical protein